jgi:hypothetical protein
MGVGIDQARVIGELLIGGGHLSRHRCVNIGSRFYRFDDRDRFAGGHGDTGFRAFDEDNITEFVLGVVGDADLGLAILQMYPFVGFGIAVIFRVIHPLSSFL